MTIADVLVDSLPLEELDEVDLRWRAHDSPLYQPLTRWIELDLLLMGVGSSFEYLIVESLATHRFVQTMGDPAALIIEVCGNAGSYHPDVWRLRRARSDRLANAELGATLFDGGMDPECLFTVEEAARVFREWLRTGQLSRFELEAVHY